MGREARDSKEMRVLNRLLHVEEHGLVYEPDPRHVELLVRDLGLEGRSSRAAPGEKQTYDEDIHTQAEPLEPLEDIVAALTHAANICCSLKEKHLHAHVDKEVAFHECPRYYVPHPWMSLLCGPIGKTTSMPVPKGCDRFTGLSHQELANIRNKMPVPSTCRSLVLRRVLREGAAWEAPTVDLINAVSKKIIKTKRICVKAAKGIERDDNAHGALNPEDSTTFRALAARANYLALDRPDVAFATKEQCRCFAAPTREAYTALKILGRY